MQRIGIRLVCAVALGCLGVVSCDGGGGARTLAEFSGGEVTVADVQAYYATLSGADQRRFLKDPVGLVEAAVRERVLFEESQRRGLDPKKVLEGKRIPSDPTLAAVAALEEDIRSATSMEVKMQPLSEEDLHATYERMKSTRQRVFKYWPARVKAIAAYFFEEADAEGFARKAKALPAEDTAAFRQAVWDYSWARARARGLTREETETKVGRAWDVILAEGEAGSRWPEQLSHAALGALPPAVVGPISAPPRQGQDRFWVLKILARYPSSGTYDEVRKKIMPFARTEKVQRMKKRKLSELVAAAEPQLDRQAIGQLRLVPTRATTDVSEGGPAPLGAEEQTPHETAHVRTP